MAEVDDLLLRRLERDGGTIELEMRVLEGTDDWIIDGEVPPWCTPKVLSAYLRAVADWLDELQDVEWSNERRM